MKLFLEKAMQHIYPLNCHEGKCEYEFPYYNYKENAKLSVNVYQYNLFINLRYDTGVRCATSSINKYYPDVTPEKLTISLYDKIMYSILTSRSTIIFPNEHTRMIEIAKSGLEDFDIIDSGCGLQYEPMEMVNGTTSNVENENSIRYIPFQEELTRCKEMHQWMQAIEEMGGQPSDFGWAYCVGVLELEMLDGESL